MLATNPFAYSGNQGLFVEYNFASTRWDLYDEGSFSDNISGDDDTSTLTGSQIEDIMVRCRL